MSVLLDIDPLTGAVETMSYDHATGTLAIKRVEQVDAILDRNVESYNDSSQAWRGDENDLWRVASVPLTWIYGLLVEFNAKRSPDTKVQDPFSPHEEWERYLYAKLNSSDYRKLRTAPVTI